MSRINPPNTPMLDIRGNVSPTWYRFFVAIQKDIVDGVAGTEEALLFGQGANGGAAPDDAGAVALLLAPPPAHEAAGDVLPPLMVDREQPDAIPILPIEPDPPIIYRAATVTVATDADFTITPNPLGSTTRHTGTLTANRTVTLSTAGAQAGTQTLVTRSGGGGFNLSVGGLKNLATNTWALAEYDGAAWFLASYGAL